MTVRAGQQKNYETMSNNKTNALALTAIAMLAFACNSLLCRLALKSAQIDPASFTLLRLLSGALVLWMICTVRSARITRTGNWASGFALFVYAAGFSFSYTTLPAAVGALILFGAVQGTMIGYGLLHGERFTAIQSLGLLSSLGGLLALCAPGLSSSSFSGAALMLCAGVAWGVYSIRGRTQGDPTLVTAGNFLRATPFAFALYLLCLHDAAASSSGALYALLSGGLASGVGYAIWYAALRTLPATIAATVQLSVPVLAALGAVLVLKEPIALRLVLCSLAILGGIAVVILARRSRT